MKHYFSDWLDDEVIRCENCGANVLWNKEYPTCEGYRAFRKIKLPYNKKVTHGVSA